MKRSTAFLTVFATLVCILAWGLVAWPTTPIWTTPAACSPAAGVIKRADWIACVQALAGEDSRAQAKTTATLPTVGTPGRLVLHTDATPTNVLRYDDGSSLLTLVEIDKTQTLTNKSLATPSIAHASTLSIGATNTPIIGHLSATASLAFSAWAGDDCQDKTITVTGAADGDSVSLGIANALASVADITWSGWVSGASTVTVRGCKVVTGVSATPSAAVVRSDVWVH
jgi:hypothetical protein